MQRRRILSAVLCIFVAACTEKEVELGAGYKYFPLDGKNAAIVDRESRMVVDPNVSQHRVVDSYIVGERVDADIDDKLSKKFGYFIFDRRNGVLIEGLDKASFEDSLHARKLK
jgi:hypothetical protein